MAPVKSRRAWPSQAGTLVQARTMTDGLMERLGNAGCNIEEMHAAIYDLLQARRGEALAPETLVVLARVLEMLARARKLEGETVLAGLAAAGAEAPGARRGISEAVRNAIAAELLGVDLGS